MKATKFCKQKRVLPGIIIGRVLPGKQKASVMELVVDSSTNNSSSNINKISVFGKGKYCFDGFKRSSS